MSSNKPPRSVSDSNAASKSSDVTRRTWDTEAYAAKARDQATQRREEGAARAEARAAGRTWHRNQLDPSTARETTSRSTRLDVSANIGKVQLVPAGASAVGKRGRGAGFYCDVCDLTFKDNVQWVEHLNSKQHLVNSGEKSEVRRATLQEVRERLGVLAERKRREREEEGRDAGEELKVRIERNQADEERRREEKRRKRREKRRKTAAGDGKGGGDDGDEWEGRAGIIY